MITFEHIIQYDANMDHRATMSLLLFISLCASVNCNLFGRNHSEKSFEVIHIEWNYTLCCSMLPVSRRPMPSIRSSLICMKVCGGPTVHSRTQSTHGPTNASRELYLRRSIWLGMAEAWASVDATATKHTS